MHNLLTYFVLGILTLSGAILSFKEVGWPSATDRKSKELRSVKVGCANTIFGIGLLLLFFYHDSPASFWDNWSIVSIVVTVLFFIIPVFVFLTIGAYVQFSAWERTQSFMTNTLRKIIKSDKDKQN